MTVALAGRAPATFEIKSATLPLVALLLKSPDLAALASELAARFGDLPDFFDHDPLVVDLSPLGPDAHVDFAALLPMLRNYRVMPVAVKGGSAAQRHAARAAGLAPAEDARESKSPDQVRHDIPAAAAPAASPSALIIDKPLRSGQQVYARGRDAVVLQMVNPGAEIIADGHIHVYAPLRGKAIAGARGNSEARIFSTCLEPELISIAGVYRTSEAAWPDEVRGKAAQVQLVGGVEGKLVVERLRTKS
jgi:septum site-determining protein MinC